MNFIASNTVEQMIFDAAAQRGGTQAPMLRWNTRLPEFVQ